jgi:hypothetical protein
MDPVGIGIPIGTCMDLSQAMESGTVLLAGRSTRRGWPMDMDTAMVSVDTVTGSAMVTWGVTWGTDT